MQKRGKYTKSTLSQQFRSCGLNMTAWAENHGYSSYTILQLSCGGLTGTRGKTKKLVELLISEGFTLPEKAA